MPLTRRHLLRLTAGTVFAASISYAARAAAPDPTFAAFLASIRTDALAAGIRASTMDSALATVPAPTPRVLDLDKKQPESTITFEQYIDRTVNSHRVAGGRAKLAENRHLLEKIGAAYNVQPRFIVALWGMETDFGASTGNFPVVASLATLAYSSPRPELFRSELIAALKILDGGKVSPAELKGSWAGAMGQTQFMPSSYLRYGVDYDHSGKADIWANRADVFASIANYLSHEGWDGAFTWGREVRLPPGFDSTLLGDKAIKSVAEWDELGVRRHDAGNLPRAALKAGLVQPEGGPVLMVYDNYRVIMKWNRSTYFATSVSYLADRIES